MTKFGVQLPNFSGPDPTDLFEHVAGLATAAEAAGFDSVWVMDHFFQLPPLGGPDQPMLEAYTLLGALAARTRRVQLGTLVTGVTYRNPGILAKIVTTLDVISRGRAIFSFAFADTAGITALGEALGLSGG
jgi:alkanesulfonate monooxygenase SsuD/methylene tetrahydromethanopterin reductase-like flavin-dependent oxidoreductase (luciferase family)